jgi:hypothetical protein
MILLSNILAVTSLVMKWTIVFLSEIYVTLGCGQFDQRDHDLNKRCRLQLENATPCSSGEENI